jgi:hypothetical protein
MHILDMKLTILDPSAFEYSILITVPFLDQEEVECYLDEDFQSKTVLREDLQRIVEEEWNQVRESTVCDV